MESTKITPNCLHNDSKTPADPANEPVCELAPRAPSSVCPPFIIIVGLTEAHFFNDFRNAFPLLIHSIYDNTYFVSLSLAAYSKKSLTLKSAPFPNETTLENLIPRDANLKINSGANTPD